MSSEDFGERLLDLAEWSLLTAMRVGVVIGLRLVAADEQPPNSLRQNVAEMLEQLAGDVSFRVRWEAAPKK